MTVPAFSAGEQIAETLNNPLAWGFAVICLFLLLALFVLNKALNTIKAVTLKAQGVVEPMKNEEAEETSALLKTLTDTVPIERESEIMLDHDYDGIKELDNNLPPWWVWGFYITIAVAVIYVYRYHFGDAPLSIAEYEQEMAEGKAQVDAYLATASNLVDETNVTFVDSESRLANGKKIFMENCVACHRADGGGMVGPNLTDEYWINGGGIVNVFKTVKYGGRPGKGMIAWQEQMNPSQMQDVASYVLSLKGSNPANPKGPEGEIYHEETTPETTTTETTDSTSTAE